MKKIISYLFIAGLLFSACDPMDDIYDELDENGITNKQQGIEYTITSDNYDAMEGAVAENHYFSENNPSADYIPSLLTAVYPTLTEGSTVKVTYNYKNEASYLSVYSDASEYELTSDDYASVSETVGVAGYFSPSNSADDYLPSILSSSVTGAENGDVYIVSYEYSDIDPEESESVITIFEQSFANDLGEFQTVSVTGDQYWEYNSYGYAKMSGYSSGSKYENEDWLISPQIDLNGYSSPVFNFTQTIGYLYDNWDQIIVAVSTDYNGSDPTTASWTTMTVPNLPSGSDFTSVNSGDIDLSNFEGETIYIGFKYLSSTSNAATWEIFDVAVKGTGATSKSAIIADPVTLEELYTYNSGWEKTEAAYYLTSLDYDAMGEEYGQPGKYNNFSSSILPIDYLPKLAELKYPYAQKNDTIIFVYKYYVSGTGTVTKADELFYTDNAWKIVIEKTDQYALSSSGWVFDPTVNYTIVSEDYQFIVDYVGTNFGSDYVDSYGTAEDYYGASAFYSEFRINSGYFESSEFSTWEEAVQEAIGEVFLPSKFSDATTQVDGVDMYYIITFAAYDGTMTDYTIKFQCTKDGPNPEFTYTEGPVAAE